MTSGLLSLKWNNHRSTFFHVLSSIRSKESYCDATLACDGRFYPVHKLVLSTCSEYFEQIFDKTQCKHPVIVLKDIRYEELEALMNYMYIGEVNVLQDKLSGLIKAAECLKVKGLAVPDEDPSFSKNNWKSLRSDLESPCAKRKRRDDHQSDERIIQDSHSPQTDKLIENYTANAKKESTKILSSSENQINKESYSTSIEDNSNNITNKYLNEDPDEQLSMKQISEIADEDRNVKVEPPDIDNPEEIDSKDNFHTVLDYNGSEGNSSIMTDDIDIRHDENDSNYSSSINESRSQHIEKVTAQVLPSSSSIHQKSFSVRDEGEGSQNYVSEEFSRYHNEGQSLDEGWAYTQLRCPHCPENVIFTCSSNFRRHLRLHTGERPYKCSLCHYTATRKQHLQSHMLRRHSIHL